MSEQNVPCDDLQRVMAALQSVAEAIRAQTAAINRLVDMACEGGGIDEEVRTPTTYLSGNPR